jgi:hypothetical protein
MAARNCRGRQLKWTICISEQVAALSGPWPKLLFTWMIPTVDNLGRMDGEPYQVRGLIFPFEAGVTDAKITAWMQELHDAALIVWYRSGRLRYVWLPKHTAHQRLAGNMKAESDFPAPSPADVHSWEQRNERYEHSTYTVRTGDEEGYEHSTSLLEEKRREEKDIVAGATPSHLVFDHWREVMGKNGTTRLDDKRQKAIRWALQNYSLDECFAAIDGCARSDWHMGRDPKTGGKKFNELTLIFRDAQHIEGFLGQEKSPTALDVIDDQWGDA